MQIIKLARTLGLTCGRGTYNGAIYWTDARGAIWTRADIENHFYGA